MRHSWRRDEATIDARCPITDSCSSCGMRSRAGTIRGSTTMSGRSRRAAVAPSSCSASTCAISRSSPRRSSAPRRAGRGRRWRGQPDGERLIEHELYGASCDDLLERLRRVPDDTGSVMVIGHNPAMQVLVLRLTGANGAAARSRGGLRRGSRRRPAQVPDRRARDADISTAPGASWPRAAHSSPIRAPASICIR